MKAKGSVGPNHLSPRRIVKNTQSKLTSCSAAQNDKNPKAQTSFSTFSSPLDSDSWHSHSFTRLGSAQLSQLATFKSFTHGDREGSSRRQHHHWRSHHLLLSLKSHSFLPQERWSVQSQPMLHQEASLDDQEVLHLSRYLQPSGSDQGGRPAWNPRLQSILPRQFWKKGSFFFF